MLERTYKCVHPIRGLEIPNLWLQDHPLVTSAFTVNSTNTLDSLSNPTVAAEQLDLWMRNRTGELGLPTGNQLGWLRLPRNSSIFETESDPSAGPSSAHYEFIFFVRRDNPSRPTKSLMIPLGCVHRFWRRSSHQW